MKHRLYLILISLLSLNSFSQIEHEEGLEAEAIHQFMIQNNLISNVIDTTTFIKSINTQASRNSGAVAPISANSFNDGDFSQFEFNLGFGQGGSLNYNNCFIPNYDPTAVGRPLDIRDKFHSFNSSQPTSSDGIYDTYIFPSAANLNLPPNFIRLGNYSIYTSYTGTESSHSTTQKWSGVSPCSNTSTNYGGFAEKSTFVIAVDNANKFYEYYYSVASTPPNTSGHDGYYSPFFSISLFDESGNEIICGKNFQIFSQNFNAPGFTVTELGGHPFAYKPWTRNFVDLSSYVGQNVTVKLETKGCTPAGHFGVLYFSGKTVNQPAITVNSVGCNNFNMNLEGFANNYSNSSLVWNFGDSTPTQTHTGGLVNHTYATPGTYVVTITSNYTIQYLDPLNYSSAPVTHNCIATFTTEINANCGISSPCEDW